MGRRKLFISNAIGMCLVLIAEAICVGINNTRSAIAAVVFVFAFEACFTWGTSRPLNIISGTILMVLGWMATVWCYPPEILPLKIRAKGAALAAAADFLGNFIVVEITPPALQNIGYKTYVIFAVLNIANAMIVGAFYPETAGSTLESIDFLFTNTDELDTKRPFYHMLQWSVVYQAEEVMERLQIKRDSAGRDSVPNDSLVA